MGTLKQSLCKLLDLPDIYVMKEAQHKLSDTFVRINGTIVFLASVGKETIDVITEDGIELTLDVRVEEVPIEVFLPDTGAYFDSKGNNIVLYKKPLRQWKKSFHSSLYDIFVNGNLSSKASVVYGLDETSRKDIWVDSEGKIKYLTKYIGEVVDSTTIICENPFFKQEIIDWIKNEKTISTVSV